jgi:preprotein translocase SecF subunit
VNPYPAMDAGAPYAVVKEGEDQARARFVVNLVALGEGIEELIQAEDGQETEKKTVTAEDIKTTLPPALRKFAHRLRNEERQIDKRRKAILEALAGPEGGEPGFQVKALADPDPSDALIPFEFSTHVTFNNEKKLTEAVGVFKESLEKAQEEQIYYAPATAFPSIDQVGSAVAKNLKSKAIISTFFCVVFICLYVWLRFDFWSGIAAIVAVFHDVLALLGFLAILDVITTQLGSTFDAKFGLTTISAFLTMVGYSINDTIVILDRIREDKADAKAKTYTPELVNAAINKTLSRTVLTSLTSLLVCLVLLVGSFIGLAAIQGFAAAMVFGIVVGTYSSMFVAAPVLLIDKRKFVTGCAVMAAFMLATGIASAFV